MSEPIQWEYRIHTILGFPTEADLNREGAKGWELVAIVHDVELTPGTHHERTTPDWQLVFKRPKQG